LNCEVCGQRILGKSMRVIIEGAKLVVCSDCSKLGKETWEPPRPRSVIARMVKPKPKPQDLPREVAEYELPEDFAKRVRASREKLSLTQEELAKHVKERLSIIQKIESGKIIPDMKLSRVLEHVLRVKLLVPRKEPTGFEGQAITPPELTLGDLVQFKQKSDKEKRQL